MFTRLIPFVAITVAVVLFDGCASSPEELITVTVDIAQVVGTAEAPKRAKVDVTDIRKQASMERMALGASMGMINLKPPAPDLVRSVVQAKADEVIARQGIAGSPLVLSGIRVFDIATPSTPIYWDINTTIEIVLRVSGQDCTVTAAATERTFVWPTEELISRVTTDALRNLAANTEQVLTDLFGAR
jgi:hypothetical protein